MALPCCKLLILSFLGLHVLPTRYIAFMTTPGSHNDAYASTCHRMFFANLALRGLAPQDCPDNDRHNVDAIDGLVLPTVVALAHAAVAASRSRGGGGGGGGGGASDGVRGAAAACVAVTRDSAALGGVAGVWAELVEAIILGNVFKASASGGASSSGGDDDTGIDLTAALAAAARGLELRSAPSASRAGAMVACYVDQSVNRKR